MQLSLLSDSMPKTPQQSYSVVNVVLLIWYVGLLQRSFVFQSMIELRSHRLVTTFSSQAECGDQWWEVVLKAASAQEDGRLQQVVEGRHYSITIWM